MKFGRMLKYDLRYGTVRRFGYYLLPLLLGVADAVRQVLNYYKVRNPGTLLDHWLIMTAGTQPYQPNTLHSYNFPTIWLIMQAFMLLVVNGYTSGDLEEHGSVMIVKSRSRAGWWLSKCGSAYPLWLCRMLGGQKIYPTSFSKYGAFYKKERNQQYDGKCD